MFYTRHPKNFVMILENCRNMHTDCHLMFFIWTYNSHVGSERMGFDLWPPCASGTFVWSSSAGICLHGSCPQAPPTASTRESSVLWFLDREAGPAGQGKHWLLLSGTASPFTGVNFQLKTCKKNQQKRLGGGMWEYRTVGASVGGNPNQLCFGVGKQAHK